VITSVGLDHCEILGNNLEDIAFEKASIMKPNRPCIIGSDLPKHVFTKMAEEKKSPLFQISTNSLDLLSSESENKEIAKSENFPHNNFFRLTLETLSRYYPEYKIPDSSLNFGIKQNLSCRKEKIKEENQKILKVLGIKNAPQALIMDVCHNSHAMVKILHLKINF
jgi:folylpolyglutamate synthase/dihydropteroate synthase